MPTTKTPARHLSVAERAARGRAARADVPRQSHDALESAAPRDPVALLEAQAPSRVPELVPIRYGRMLVSPFTFYRGAAAIMAEDLAATPTSGLRVQLCGDAHLSNFGGFASPSRTLVFDLNDFDETLPGPFEWDVKRLAASFEIAGRDRGFAAAERRAAVVEAVRVYRDTMLRFASMGNLAVWYAALDLATIEAVVRAESREGAKKVARASARARTKDSMKAFAKLSRAVDGGRRFVSDPPLVVPIHELLTNDADRDRLDGFIHHVLRGYLRTLQRDRRRLLEDYRYMDLARKLVGVGSVGTRCWIVLMLGRDEQDPLVLQVKEAQPSVLEARLGRSSFANHGQRVVEGQRVMQSASDIFLGWIRSESGLDGVARDFYVRQLWDWKMSVELDTILPRGLLLYARACGGTLAKAHARSGDRVAIAAYLGKKDAFVDAVADFAAAYADLNEADYETFAAAVRDGRIAAESGI